MSGNPAEGLHGNIIDDLHRGEVPLSLARAAKDPCVRRDGCPRHPSALYRWARSGVNGVTLEFALQGKRMVTTRSALLRFIARLSLHAAPRSTDPGYDH